MNTFRFVLVMLAILAIASAASAQVDGVMIAAAPDGAGGGGGGMGGGGGYGGSGGGSIGVPKQSIVAVDQRISWLQSQMRQVEIAFAAAEESLKATKQRVDSGLAPTSELRDVEIKVAQHREQFGQLRREMATVQRLKILATPIDISLKSSPMRQAAEIIGRASKLSISVDPKVPQDLQVNAEAENVPLGAVLEVVANAAGLIIAPTEDGGLLLRTPGKLVVDGQTYTTDRDSPPWSDDWGIVNWPPPSVGRRWLGLFQTILVESQHMPMMAPRPAPMPGPPPDGVVPPPPVPPANVKPAPKPPVKGGGAGGAKPK